MFQAVRHITYVLNSMENQGCSKQCGISDKFQTVRHIKQVPNGMAYHAHSKQ